MGSNSLYYFLASSHKKHFLKYNTFLNLLQMSHKNNIMLKGGEGQDSLYWKKILRK